MNSIASINRPVTVNEKSVWDAREIEADSSWRYTLSESDVAELKRATDKVVHEGLQVGEFGRDEFPLPTLGARIETLVDNVENGRGLALLRGIPVQDYDEHGLRLLYWGFGGYAGELISQNSKGQLLAEVSDRGNAYSDRNTRGFSTNAELFPHVDTSDMTTLLCVRDAKHGGESRIVSATKLFNIVCEEHPEYLPILFRGFHNDLRGEGPTTRIDELTHKRVPVFSQFAGRTSCSFNLRMIENAVQKSGEPLTPDERAALDFLRDISLREELGVRFRMQPGDIMMVSNHSVLHSRASFEDWPEPQRRRCLYRFWVNILGGRELEPAFADRYNTGPRGGVAVGDGARYAF